MLEKLQNITYSDDVCWVVEGVRRGRNVLYGIYNFVGWLSIPRLFVGPRNFWSLRLYAFTYLFDGNWKYVSLFFIVYLMMFFKWYRIL